jgi:hypothetical protein
VIVPTCGVSDQLTPTFNAPAIDELNCTDCPAPTDADVGVTAIPTVETSQTVELAVFVGSARLWAITVTAWGVLTIAGAV